MYLTNYFQFHLFLIFFKWPKSVIFDKTSSGGNKKKFNKILIGNTRVERNAFYYFYQNWFLLVVLTYCKGTHFKFQWNFTKKRRKFIFKHYFLLHSICYIAHQWFIWTTRNLCFRMYFYNAPRRSQKITMLFFTFVTGWNTLPGACWDLDLFKSFFEHPFYHISICYVALLQLYKNLWDCNIDLFKIFSLLDKKTRIRSTILWSILKTLNSYIM